MRTIQIDQQETAEEHKTWYIIQIGGPEVINLLFHGNTADWDSSTAIDETLFQRKLNSSLFATNIFIHKYKKLICNCKIILYACMFYLQNYQINFIYTC
jgi:hypothetical protein